MNDAFTYGFMNELELLDKEAGIKKLVGAATLAASSLLPATAHAPKSTQPAPVHKSLLKLDRMPLGKTKPVPKPSTP